ncbi:RHS repeat-associated core domain-containing protein [Streptomyces sp. NPDC086787]|uniref:RHS repeat-associated core domain-containing protein n=1 Tax=Streptomyces sp. NPDC086787 TaxID=3365759 RepID=UPI0037FB647E
MDSHTSRRPLPPLPGRRRNLSARLAAPVAFSVLLSLLSVVPGLGEVALAAGAVRPQIPKALSPGSVKGSSGETGYLPGSWKVSPSGDFTYSIPLDVPDGRAGMAPSLSLGYSSGGGNGSVGQGWAVSGAMSAITRCTKSTAEGESTPSGVHDDWSDDFCLDGQKLVQLGSGSGHPLNAEYRAKTNGFGQVLSVTAQANDSLGGPDHFTVKARDGRIRTYEARQGHRMSSGVGFSDTAAPSTGDAAFSTPRVMWLLESDRDRSGNEIDYEYTSLSGPGGDEWLPAKISYTAHGNDKTAARYVQFDYEDRPDTSFSYLAGVRFNQTRRIKSVKMFAPNPGATKLVWQYNLAYDISVDHRSLLKSVAKCAPSGGCLLGKNFTWDTSQKGAVPSFHSQDLDALPVPIDGPSATTPFMRAADINGDGADDLLMSDRAEHPYGSHNLGSVRLGVRKSDTGTVSPLEKAVSVAQNDALGMSGTDLRESRPVDLGEGRASLALRYEDPATKKTKDKVVKWNDADQAFKATAMEFPNADNSVFADFNGDGRMDYASADGAGGAYSIRLNKDGELGAAKATAFTWDSAESTTGDPTGEGKASVISVVKNAAGKYEPTVLSLVADGDPVVTSGRHKDANGKTWDHVMSPLAPSFTGKYWNYRTVTGDFNGDGLQDYLLLPVTADAKGDWRLPAALVWNTGDGLVVDKKTPDIPYDKYAGVQAADLNADGRTDLVTFTPSATTALISRGDGSFDSDEIASDGGTLGDGNDGWASSRVGDFSATGRPGVVRVSNGHLVLLSQDVSYTGRLTGIADQGTLWNRQSVTYSTAWSDHMEKAADYDCAAPLVCGRSGIVTVRQVDSRDHVIDPDKGQTPKPYKIQYSFEDPVADVRTGFLGFLTMRVWDPQRPSETLYDFNRHREQVGAGFHPYVNRPTQVTTVTPILTLDSRARAADTVKARVTSTHNTYGVRHLNQRATSGGQFAVFTTGVTTDEWEQNVDTTWGSLVGTDQPSHFSGVAKPPTPQRQSAQSSDFDDFGNRTHHTESVTGGASATTDTTFTPDTSAWLVNLPMHQTVTSKAAGGKPGPVTRTTDFHYDTLGRLDTLWQEKDGADDVALTTTYRTDPYGVLDRMTVSADGVPDKVTHLEHDPVFPQQPDEEIYTSQSWSEHKGGPAPSQWLAVHPALGVTLAASDANGVQTASDFDDLGRPVKVTVDGQAPTSFTYSKRTDTYGGTNGTITTASIGLQPQTPQVTQTFTDALGRTVKTKSTGFDGTLNTTATDYDVLGRPASITAPAPVGTTTTDYDSLDRPVTTTLPDDKTIKTSYTFSTATTTDQNGAVTETTADPDSRLAARTVTDTSTSPDRKITTSYSYGPFGLPYQVTDANKHTTTYTHDVLGRQTKVDDPNGGVTTDTYYATGQLDTETHEATGHSTTFGDFDDLGRYTTRKSEDGTSTFVYDTAPHGIGKLATATSPDRIKTAYRYDTAGRLTGTDYTDQSASVPVTYSTDQTFDTTGRPDTLTYPGAVDSAGHRYTVQNGYNGTGFLSTLTDTTQGQTNKTLWTVKSRTPSQALDTAQYGSGSAALTLKNSYDAPTGRLHNTTVTNNANTKVQDLTYTYWDNSLLKTQTDAVGDRSEAYTYDPLGQLTDWSLTNGTKPKTTTSYTYDPVGNLTDTAKNGTTTEHHAYGAPGGDQPDTLTTITPTGENSQTLTYDGQGRQTTGNGRTTTYTSYNLPKTITRNGTTTTFAYDAFGRKAKETTPTTSTFYIPGLYEHRTKNDGSAATDVYYLQGSDGPIGQTVNDGHTLRTEYTLTNHLGSTTAVADNTGAINQRIYTDPFGNNINPDGSPNTSPTGNITHTFTNQENQPTLGLINMNGRQYDPTTHTFLTPDPLNTPGTSPYPYVHNSPLNHTDPTGYLPCDTAQLAHPHNYGPEDCAHHALGSREAAADDALFSQPAMDDHCGCDYSSLWDAANAADAADVAAANAGVNKSDDTGYQNAQINKDRVGELAGGAGFGDYPDERLAALNPNCQGCNSPWFGVTGPLGLLAGPLLEAGELLYATYFTGGAALGTGTTAVATGAAGTGATCAANPEACTEAAEATVAAAEALAPKVAEAAPQVVETGQRAVTYAQALMELRSAEAQMKTLVEWSNGGEYQHWAEEIAVERFGNPELAAQDYDRTMQMFLQMITDASERYAAAAQQLAKFHGK